MTTPEVPSSIYTALLLRAIRFAADKHRDQRRKDAGASPYINHPICVAEVLARVGGVTDPVTLIAGILHDTVEDTQTTFGELDREFGPEVRSVVAEVTDDKTLAKEKRKRLQVERAAEASHRAKEVKLADKICNVLDISSNPPATWTYARRIEYLDWSIRVVAGLRGTNAGLEQHFDEVVEGARAALHHQSRSDSSHPAGQ
jgi:GTP diphosphokinase / guanosine-3',5'-bis(diphosphate) 3'-diphosphatase